MDDLTKEYQDRAFADFSNSNNLSAVVMFNLHEAVSSGGGHIGIVVCFADDILKEFNRRAEMWLSDRGRGCLVYANIKWCGVEISLSRDNSHQYGSNW